MGDRSEGSDASARLAAAHATVAPWLESLGALERWFAAQAQAIWPGAGEQRAREVLALLQQALAAMARGEEAVARPTPLPPAACDNGRLDLLMAQPRSARRSTSPALAERRRNALLDLALWSALRRLSMLDTPARAGAPGLARLHGWLARPTPPAPGVSPTLAYAASSDARRFFGDTVRGVLVTLSRRADGGAAAYSGMIPPQPFDNGLPALVAWSQAWSVAVAGAYLDSLCRHARDDLQQALRDIWSGRLAAVRFRTGPGLTALPARDGALHLDLWTCAVKAQALAFDPARWQAQAAGVPWHAVHVDMHDLSGNGAGSPGAASVRRVATGLSVESLYRTVFIDRLHAVLAQTDSGDDTPQNHDPLTQVRSVTIDMDPPRNGQLPNLRLLLRWRNPSDSPPRFIGQDDVSGTSSPRSDALHRWHGGHGDDSVAHALDSVRIDWHAAAPDDRFVDAGGGELVALGHAALWASMDPAVQWIDAALMVSVDGAWYELPAVLHEPSPREGAGGTRTWWLLPADAPLPASLNAAALQRASASTAALQWVAHEEGVGAFVMVAIDVDAWRRTLPS